MVGEERAQYLATPSATLFTGVNGFGSMNATILIASVLAEDEQGIAPMVLARCDGKDLSPGDLEDMVEWVNRVLLDQIKALMDGARPTPNPEWKEVNSKQKESILEWASFRRMKTWARWWNSVRDQPNQGTQNEE